MTARDQASGAAAAWRCDALLRRDATVNTTHIIGPANCTPVGADDAMSGVTVSIGADQVNGTLRITATGLAGTAIRWVALVDTVEVK